MNGKPILDPLLKLLWSRKFLVLMSDIVIALLVHYIGGDELDFLIATLQPAVIMIIYAIAKEDSARFAADASVDVARLNGGS